MYGTIINYQLDDENCPLRESLFFLSSVIKISGSSLAVSLIASQ